MLSKDEEVCLLKPFRRTWDNFLVWEKSCNDWNHDEKWS